MVDSSRQAGILIPENLTDVQYESCGIILEFGDLSVEKNRIRLLEAMILDRVLPGAHRNANRLEVAMFKLPRRTVNELMTTRAKLFEAHHESAAIVLKGMQRRYVSKGYLQASDPLF
jgi:hypothetical protein